MTDEALRIELFADSVQEEAAFFEDGLGFRRTRNDPGYVALEHGHARLAIAAISSLPAGHPIRPSGANARLGLGVEIVIETADVDAAYADAVSRGIRPVSQLSDQSWGGRDFRVLSPSGYYVRVTSR